MVWRMGFLEFGPSLLAQEAVLRPLLPLESVLCPLWDTCAGPRRGWVQEAVEDTYRLLGLWRRTTWTKVVVFTTCYVSLHQDPEDKVLFPKHPSIDCVSAVGRSGQFGVIWRECEWLQQLQPLLPLSRWGRSGGRGLGLQLHGHRQGGAGCPWL